MEFLLFPSLGYCYLCMCHAIIVSCRVSVCAVFCLQHEATVGLDDKQGSVLRNRLHQTIKDDNLLIECCRIFYF